MHSYRPRFAIRTLLVLVAVAAIVYAILAVRPSAVIKLEIRSNGEVVCESKPCADGQFQSELSEQIARRKRWWLTPEALVIVDKDVGLQQVTSIMQRIASSGCERVQLGLPPELSSQLTRPDLTSEPPR